MTEQKESGTSFLGSAILVFVLVAAHSFVGAVVVYLCRAVWVQSFKVDPRYLLAGAGAGLLYFLVRALPEELQRLERELNDANEAIRYRDRAIEELKLKLTQEKEFLESFHPSQEMVDAILTAGAQQVNEACENLKLLYLQGLTGVGSHSTARGPVEQVIGTKEIFEGVQDVRCKVLDTAVRRFGRLLDLAKWHGYTVKQCWPEYVGLSSEEAPAIQSPRPAGSGGAGEEL